ncbi:unnamed protein product [Allacma fusca]|uniref:Uncharacterized protein n=1 Tax=Allacma fusca TaxID=39272 RepID=A0A8J2Q2D9_9HEXA|nr:unnamed protein product [Allacma fusca]
MIDVCALNCPSNDQGRGQAEKVTNKEQATLGKTGLLGGLLLAAVWVDSADVSEGTEGSSRKSLELHKADRTMAMQWSVARAEKKGMCFTLMTGEGVPGMTRADQ